MNTTKRLVGYLSFCSAAILMIACANQMEPAKNDIDNINATLKVASAEAQKYVPDQFAAVQSKVAALTTSFANKDYAAVVAAAPGVLSEVNGLAAEAAAKKDEALKALGKQWRSLADSVPQSVKAVQAKIDSLSNKHVPKDVDLGSAKAGLADASAAWDRAETAFKSGNQEDAVAAAKDAQSKLDSAAAALKLDLTQSNPRSASDTLVPSPMMMWSSKRMSTSASASRTRCVISSSA